MKSLKTESGIHLTQDLNPPLLLLVTGSAATGKTTVSQFLKDYLENNILLNCPRKRKIKMLRTD